MEKGTLHRTNSPTSEQAIQTRPIFTLSQLANKKHQTGLVGEHKRPSSNSQCYAMLKGQIERKAVISKQQAEITPDCDFSETSSKLIQITQPLPIFVFLKEL